MSKSDMGDNVKMFPSSGSDPTPTPLSTQTTATAVSAATSKKRPYQGKSTVWDHLTKIQLPKGKPTHCTCNYCGKELACSSSIGTSSLKRHIDTCKKYPYNRDSKQSTITWTNVDGDGLKNWKFDQELIRKRIAEMIIIDELPFSFVENRGFRNVMMAACPRYQFVSRTTVTKDCWKLYVNEKKSLKETLGKCGRIALTTDLWTSIQNLGYMCLTAHYVDEDWQLQKKIINFQQIPSPHTGEAIAHVVELCLLDWGIQDLSTITVDNASSNNNLVRALMRKLNKKGSLLLDGEHFHVRCCAHILNLIVRDGVEEAKESINKIRNSVKYVRSSPSRMQQFKNCVEQERITCQKNVCLDVTTRWNSTFLMLESSIPYQKAFERLEEQDPYFGKDLKDGPPTEGDWIVARCLCRFLESFFKTTKRLSGSLYVTANAYFNEVILVKHRLSQWSKSGEPCFREMAKRMKEKFDKYWGSIDKMNMLLIIAIVLDPRYKLGYVRFYYEKYMGIEKADEVSSKIKRTLECIYDVYKERESKSVGVPPSSCDVIIDTAMDTPNDDDEELLLKNEFREVLKTTTPASGKSELEQYLEERLEDESSTFDVLLWWKINTSKYHILASMTRDFLATPVSTVASESAFSTGGRVLDRFRSSLTPKIVECLICTQDWLRSTGTPVEIEEKLEDLEQLEITLDEDVVVIEAKD